MRDEQPARTAYEAYRTSLNGRRGESAGHYRLPWDMLPPSHREAWLAAVAAIRDHIEPYQRAEPPGYPD